MEIALFALLIKKMTRTRRVKHSLSIVGLLKMS